ncbi:MBL fold metallo-hydrolase [soil metagenome]
MPNEPTISAVATLERAELPRLFVALLARGYEVVGPTVRDGAIVYDHLAQPGQLPVLGRALDQLPPRLILYGIEGRDFHAGEKLSPEIDAAVDKLVRRVRMDCAVVRRDRRSSLTKISTTKHAMYLNRFFVPGLAHASYLFGADGEAAVVDPKRDVEDYLTAAEQEGLKIVAIFNSHPHADFASGFRELAQRTGAKVYVSHLAPAHYERVAARDGERVKIGSLEVELLETPGHSPDSLSFLVRDNGQPTAVFTGDLLFVNDVGRPDLRDADEDPSDLAGKLYDSLHEKILTLPDEVKVYPSHGAGSLCGRAISDAPFSLVGQERKLNWAMQIEDRAEFVRQMTANLPDRPAYFSFDVELNLEGADPFSALPPLGEMSEEELQHAVDDGAAVIDLRSPGRFGGGHFPGSLNIGVGSPSFSTWSGFMVPGEKAIALVVGSAEEAKKARLELARIGFDNVRGYIRADALGKTQTLPQMSVAQLKAKLQSNGPILLDVRTPTEWKSGHIDDARHVPLSSFAKELPELPNEQPVAIICGSGYRSSVASSLLRAHGYTEVANVSGGMSAYAEAAPPA